MNAKDSNYFLKYEMGTPSEGLKLTKDVDAKWILRHRDVLAKIVQYAIPEFKNCSYHEIVDAIPVEGIKLGEVPVNSDLAKLNHNEIPRLNEAPIVFDVLFRDIRYNLMIDIEPQGRYNPGYPLAKRGMYYLSRMLSSQLNLQEKTDYNILRKCYSIWLCFDLLSTKNPREAGTQYYKIRQFTESGKESSAGDADLMELIIVRAGGECNLNDSLREFVTALFRDTSKLDKYLERSTERTAIVKEASELCNWGAMQKEQGIEIGKERGIAIGELKHAITTVKRALDEGIPDKLAFKLAGINEAIYNKYKDSFGD